MRKKQIRTMLVLVLIIVGCIGAALYLRSQKAAETLPAATDNAFMMQEVTDALAQMEERGEGDIAVLQATADESTAQKAALVFLGLGSDATMQSLLAGLGQSGLDATFFVTGEDATDNIASLSLVANAGYPIGVAYSGGASDEIAAKRAVSELIRTGMSIQTAAGIWPSQVLALSEPQEPFLAAAYASSMNTVLVPTTIASLRDVTTAESVQTLLGGLERGAILCVQLNRLQGTDATAFASFLTALADTDLDTRAEGLIQTEGQMATPVRQFHTVERSVAFTFSGLGNRAELTGVLAALKDINGKATFFVTKEEAARNAEDIQLILDAGHSLGIAVQAARFTSVDELLKELLATEEAIHNGFAYAGKLPVRPAFGTANDLLMQACGAGNYTLLGSMINAVRAEDARAADVQPIVAQLFPEGNGVLQRGAIVHFQMKQYQSSDALLGTLVKTIADTQNIYAIKPAMDIAGNTADLYTYPLPDDAILADVKGKIFPGQLTSSAMTAIATRYIGIDWVNTKNFLPGFTSEEIKRLDKTGLVPNNGNMVFLTFDDWGTDRTITDILDVLRAHNAKATFFIRTQNVNYNPNLVRAIAAEGHTIGSHTHTHYPLSNDTGNGRKFTELSEEQVAELTEDLVTSYDVLSAIVGDMQHNGRPVLCRLFRPPTLAVGKNGLTAVLDAGFTYSVSAYYTSQDYKATSATQLASALKRNTKSGSVIIMHMSDNSIYTAEGLDIYLSEIERSHAEEPFQFVGLDAVLN